MFYTDDDRGKKRKWKEALSFLRLHVFTFPSSFFLSGKNLEGQRKTKRVNSSVGESLEQGSERHRKIIDPCEAERFGADIWAETVVRFLPLAENGHPGQGLCRWMTVRSATSRGLLAHTRKWVAKHPASRKGNTSKRLLDPYSLQSQRYRPARIEDGRFTTKPANQMLDATG